MTIDFEKVTEAIEKSSPEIKNLMFSAELADKIGIIAEENKLEEETALKFIDEVGYVILDLKSKTSFFTSLTEIGIDKDLAQKIANKVETEIFTELDKIKNKTTEQPQPQNNVGTSFEQIILNQAKAMMPARPAGWVPPDRSMNYESRIMNEKKEVPDNVPINNEPKAIHNYITEPDPYREPLE